MSRTLFAAALGVAVSAVTLRAAAQDAGTDAPEAAKHALGTHQKNLRLSIGDRTQFIKSRGFDPFSERDALSQVSLGASWGFWAQGKLSLAADLGYDYGGSSAAASRRARTRRSAPRTSATRPGA